MNIARVLMVQGTSSSVGKSLLVTGLCRAFARRGVKVAPFKSQNMSNNAAICPDSGEIGRAQAVQALAAGVTPTVDMNPVLLKPEADNKSQVIVRGEPWQTLTASSYYERKQQLWTIVTESLDRLRSQVELVIVEGAGSPVELNLSAFDIVNMAIARYARCPVLLAGDIDRGGVFAQMLGTLALLEPNDRRLVRGLIVNKFRGDPSLFTDGIAILEARGGVPVLGVVPYLANLGLPDEDAATLKDSGAPIADGKLDIAVIHLPHIANLDDFDPLTAEPGVRVRYVTSTQTLGQPAVVILPGTKSTMSDMMWLRRNGLADAIGQLANKGTSIVGLCGGYQMLGNVIHDPHTVERSGDIEPSIPGLGLLPVTTTFGTTKTTGMTDATVTSGSGWLNGLLGTHVSGYEIHMGQTDTPCPWLTISRRNNESANVPDGAASSDGRIWGCYLHRLFGTDSFRRAWLASLGHTAISEPFSDRERTVFDRLADTLETSLNMPLLDSLIAQGVDSP